METEKRLSATNYLDAEGVCEAIEEEIRRESSYTVRGVVDSSTVVDIIVQHAGCDRKMAKRIIQRLVWRGRIKRHTNGAGVTIGYVPDGTRPDNGKTRGPKQRGLTPGQWTTSDVTAFIIQFPEAAAKIASELARIRRKGGKK